MNMEQHDHPSPDTGNFFWNLLQVYVPRQQCMFHETGLIGLHIVSDLLIASAYFSIPIALVYLARRREDIAFNWMFFLFALFIILCGTTHLFGILAIWHPIYRLDGLIKLLTGLVSVATAILLWRLMPHALALPSQRELLQRKDELEVLVHRRTSELTKANDALRESESEYRLLAEKADSANRKKSEFMANMSHELRTPMNAVIGLSNILAMSQPLTEKQQEFIRTLQLSADSLLALINDLLDISKIEARTVELEKLPFSIETAIHEVIDMMAVPLSEKGLTVTVDDECVRDRTFIGDPARMRQIILNLYSNAIKFTEKGCVHIGVACDGPNIEGFERVRISVRDTGIGIPVEKQETIFEKFVQADASISRKYGGTGLGLAITKTLTHIMGGTLTVESIPGEGATFTICVSLVCINRSFAELARETFVASEISGVANKGERILLIEDHAPNILVAGTYLEQFGIDYDVARNGQEGVEKATNGHYFAILMDVQMPGVNGLEATRLIRADEERKGVAATPIIGMTAHALEGDRERCIAAGMNDYLAKPVTFQELRTKLETIKAQFYLGSSENL